MDSENELIQPIPTLPEWPKMPSRLAQRLRTFTPLQRRARILFAGPAGSGRGRAAAILAGDVEADLYRIDVAAVVSKYIGETENNLGSLVRQVPKDRPTVLLLTQGEVLEEVRLTLNDLLRKVERFSGPVIVTTAGPVPEVSELLMGVVQFA